MKQFKQFYRIIKISLRMKILINENDTGSTGYEKIANNTE